MKNVLLLFCLLMTIHVSAQFSIGIKAGYTNAWEEYGDVGLPDDAEIDISGFNISTFAYYKINKHFQVGIEPGFVQRGAACVPGWNNGTFPIFNGDTKVFLNYVEAPVMIKGDVSFFKNKLELFGKMGYGINFLASGYQERFWGNDEPPVKSKLDLDRDSNMNRLDHGAYGGFGIGYNFGKHQVFAELDYFVGMKDAERFNTSKNRSADFSLGYLIRL